MLVLYIVLMMVTKGGMISVARSVFQDSDFGEGRGVGISRVEGFVLHRGVKVDFYRGDNVDRELGVQTDVDSIPGTPYSVWV